MRAPDASYRRKSQARLRCGPISSPNGSARLAKSQCLVQFATSSAHSKRQRGRGGGVFSQFLQLTLAGVAQGCVYALVALGFVLIYKATETVNFAQGDLMMLGAFFGLTASTVLGWPYWATILFAIVVMAAVGMLIERIVIRPVLGYPTFTVVMITIGIGYVLRGVVIMLPG